MFFLAIVLVVILQIPGIALASNDFTSTPPDNTNVEASIQSTLYLKVWSTSITQKNGTSIQVTGDTESYLNVDTIQVKLYLQYWDGYQWQDATHINTYTNSDSSYVYGVANLTVQSGYHYRAKGVHYINKSGSVEQVSSYSGSVYIQ